VIARSIVKMAVWNLIVAASVFLPAFIAGGIVTRTILGFPFPEGGVANEIAGLVLLYLGLSVAVVVGVLVHTAVLSVFLGMRSGRNLQRAAIGLSPLVLLTPSFLGIPGGTVFAALADVTALL